MIEYHHQDNRKGDSTMLDREDLQAIAQLIRESENRMKTLIDQEVTPKFNLLAENQATGQEISYTEVAEKLDELETLDIRVTTLEAAVKKLNREVQQLKKAQ